MSIDGGDGSDRIIGPNQDTKWTIDGPNSGTADGISSFTSIESLVGGRGSDRFIFEVGGSISGSVDGGGGDDLVSGPDAANSWTLTGANSSTLAGVATFVSIEALIGGAGRRLPRVARRLARRLPRRAGSRRTTAPRSWTRSTTRRTARRWRWTSGSSPPGLTMFFGIDVVIGGGGANDVLVGPGQPGDTIMWTIDGSDYAGAGGCSFTAFANLTGQGGAADSFLFTKTGSLSGVVDGGTGAGVIDGFAVTRGVNDVVAFVPPAVGAGTVVIDSRTFHYAGWTPSRPAAAPPATG